MSVHLVHQLMLHKCACTAKYPSQRPVKIPALQFLLASGAAFALAVAPTRKEMEQKKTDDEINVGDKL